MEILGIDIGGSGIKGATVNTETGELTADRYRLDTPQPATPDAVADALLGIIRHFGWSDRPIGCTYPGVVKNGMTLTAANVDKGWIGLNAAEFLSERTGAPVFLLNDADAAGIAEMRFGAGKGKNGTVIMLTLGTGIGSAVFHQGVLLPNTEFGHLEIRGKAAEQRASARVKKEKNMSWEEWCARLSELVFRMERLLTPDLFILGGGITKKADSFLHMIKSNTPLLPARFQNQSGIIGAAIAANVLASANPALS